MSTLIITTTYDTAQVLTEAQLDEIKTPIETYFNTTQIEGANIQANILDGATYLADDSISTDKIASNAVTTAKLVDSTPSSDTGITSAKINTNAVTTAKIDDLAVTTAKIDDGDVTTAKIGNNEVPKTLFPVVPTASSTITDLSVTRTTTGASGVDTTVGSIVIEGLTIGKPVIISIQSTSTASSAGFIEQKMAASFVKGVVAMSLSMKRDGTLINKALIRCGHINAGFTNTVVLPPSCYTVVDIATATSHTYTLLASHIDTQARDTGDNLVATSTATDTTLSRFTFSSTKLVAIQIV